MVHVLFKQQMQPPPPEIFGVSTVSIETTTGTFLIILIILIFSLKIPKGK